MKIAAPLLALILSTLSNSGMAIDAGTAAVEALGRLNGVALACKQPALVARARNAVITTAPKTRGYGEVFENATNAAYLEQGKGGVCPDAANLSSNMAAAEQRMKSAFADSK